MGATLWASGQVRIYSDWHATDLAPTLHCACYRLLLYTCSHGDHHEDRAPPATLTEQEPPQADAEPRRRRGKKRRARRSASRSAEQEARFSVNAVRIQRHGEHDPGARSPADAPQQEWVALIASPQHQQRPPLVPSVCQHTVSRPLRASWSGWQIEGHEAWLEVAMRGEIAVVWQRLLANTTVCKPGLLGVACGARPGEFDDGSACRFLHCQPAVSHPSSAFGHLAARKLWERF